MTSQLLSKLVWQRVPRRASSAFALLGSLCLLCCAALALSGLALLLRYHPTNDAARLSVSQIQHELAFGWLFRGIHALSARLLMGLLTIHIALNLYLAVRSQDSAHLRTWKSGFLAFAAPLVAAWSGSILPYDESAQAATHVSTAIASQSTAVGQWLAATFEKHPVPIAFRLHLLSSVVLLGALVLHLKRIREQRLLLFRITDHDRKRLSPRSVLGAILSSWMLVAILVIALSAFGDSSPEPYNIRPAFYFMPLFLLIKLIPHRIGPVPGAPLACIVFVALLLLTFLFPLILRKRA